jgi:hypothetical protein
MGVGAGKGLDLADPVAGFETILHREDGEDGHHALKGPYADVSALRDDKTGTVDEKMVAHEMGQVAGAVDPLHGDFDSGHGRRQICCATPPFFSSKIVGLNEEEP